MEKRGATICPRSGHLQNSLGSKFNMQIAGTIVPIFFIVILGWFLRKKGFVPPEFVGPANKIAFYIAIPAMIFGAISKASFRAEFNPTVLMLTFFSILSVFVISWMTGRAVKTGRNHLGTFIQASIHGNLGYIGLAVAYYHMGQAGFVKAGIIGGFMMLLQNFLSVTALVLFNKEAPKTEKLFYAKKLFGNPVIISAVAGMLFSVIEVPVPDIIGRVLDMLSGLALPLALLVIGASLSFEVMRQTAVPVLLSSFFKLMLLPGIGFVLYYLNGISSNDYLPGLILLASPTATIAFIMAKEMSGDTDFAVAAISFNTLISAATFIFWLNIAS